MIVFLVEEFSAVSGGSVDKSFFLTIKDFNELIALGYKGQDVEVFRMLKPRQSDILEVEDISLTIQRVTRIK